MKLSPSIKAAIVTEANRAPSVHNTQPARWAFNDDAIQIYADESRFLDVGDPNLQDAGLSCGAALEGTAIALARHNISASIQDFWSQKIPSPYSGHRLAAKLILSESATLDSLSQYVDQRFTWRGHFEKTNPTNALLNWGKAQTDITLISNSEAIEELANLNDAASLQFFKNRAYREELLSYMRLSKKHPLWNQDGLNSESMHLSSFESVAANIALRYPTFESINRLGLGKAIVTEASKTKSASAIAFFTTPKDTSPVDMGRAFYRRWLEITRLGYAVWPMAVLADDPKTNTFCHAQYGIEENHKIINVLRIGSIPNGSSIPPARLPRDVLILDEVR